MTRFQLLSAISVALGIFQSPSGAMAFVKPFVVNRESSRFLLRSKRTHAPSDTPYFLSNKARLPGPVPGCKVSLPSDVCEQTGVTLSRYILEYIRANPEMKGIDTIFTALQTATKTISKLVRNSHFNGMHGLHNEENGGSVNIQGEEQKKLDVVTNDVIKKALKWSGKFTSFASEEEDDPVPVFNNLGNEVYSNDVIVTTEETSGYVAVFDPLDGSSNVDAGIPTGTIFGIFSSDADLNGHDNEQSHLRDILQPGRNLVAAGYCLYSSAVTLVFTLGCGVVGFTLDESIGEFRLTHKIMIPQRGKIYSFNESNHHQWDLALQKYVSDLQQGLGESKQHYTSRYIGSMVADVHRTLLYGGIFGYPSDNKNKKGKLRLLYGTYPLFAW